MRKDNGMAGRYGLSCSECLGELLLILLGNMYSVVHLVLLIESSYNK
jgi:hypothetical protein